MTIEWGDAPTWVAAIGTVGTLGAALLQIETERRRRIQQEKADREEHRREQARLISGWVGPHEEVPGADPALGVYGRRAPLFLMNGSNEPVYNVVCTIVMVQGAGGPRRGEDWAERAREKGDTPRTSAAILPPGRWRVWIRGGGWSSDRSPAGCGGCIYRPRGCPLDTTGGWRSRRVAQPSPQLL